MQPSPSPPAWHDRTPEAVAAALAVDPDTGLTRAEAARRLELAGPNTLAGYEGRTLGAMLADQARDVMLWVLLGATAVSVAVGEHVDALVIVAIIVLNAGLGLAQEWKAERSLAALRRLSAPQGRVVRDGQETALPAADLVPGDLVRLEAGDVVPADLRLLSAFDLRVDEAALTGESEDVAKRPDAVLPVGAPLGDRVNLAFAGTAVTRGRGAGLVCATGGGTEVGRIADLLGEVEEGKTPLQGRLEALSRTLALAVLAVCGLVFAVGLLRGLPPVGLFLTSVSLAVAAIPEGLPAVVTIVLALGTATLARRNVVTRRLRAVETLGSTTVICTDKTGTLTQNRMSVRRWWTPSGEGAAPEDAPARLREVAALCGDARIVDAARLEFQGDPTETALLAFSLAGGTDPVALAAEQPRCGELAFSAERRRMTTLHRVDGGARALVKGAPDALLPRCTSALRAGVTAPLSPGDRSEIEAAQGRLAGAALRVLALAYRDFPALPALDEGAVESELTFVGLVGLTDPPRPEAAEAVRRSRGAGVRVVMITGDHATTAAAIARDLDLPGGVLSGADLAALSAEELRERSEQTHLYARVSPGDKLRIVEAYQATGHVVAMTGDGVNDGPALKKADVGVAMGRSGTDVARGAADLVLLDDNFASIVAAVEEGRRIFDNIRRFVFYLLSCNVSEVLTLLLAVLIGLPQPLLPIQLLWLNLVTDGLPALALGTEPAERDAMRRPPRDPREGVLTPATVRGILLYGGVITAASLAAYAHGLYWFCLAPAGHQGAAAFGAALDAAFWQSPAVQPGLAAARTLAFGALAFGQLAHAFNCRSRVHSGLRLRAPANPALLLAVAVSAAAQVLVINTPWGNRIFDTVPIGGGHLAVGVLLSAVPLFFGAAVRRRDQWLRERLSK
jgi:Ca2+-transporting ATPase